MHREDLKNLFLDAQSDGVLPYGFIYSLHKSLNIEKVILLQIKSELGLSSEAGSPKYLKKSKCPTHQCLCGKLLFKNEFCRFCRTHVMIPCTVCGTPVARLISKIIAQERNYIFDVDDRHRIGYKHNAFFCSKVCRGRYVQSFRHISKAKN